MTNPLAQDLGGVVRLLEKATHDFGKDEGFIRSTDIEALIVCADFLRAHSAEIAGALRDADRYRWLRAQNAITETRDSWTITRCDFTDEDEPIRYWVGDDLDTAIDSAMQQGDGGGEAAA